MTYENPRPVYPNELYHHGIFGQHWGETNGPPYPLGSGTHNRVVRQGIAKRKLLSFRETYNINQKLSKNDAKISKLRGKQANASRKKQGKILSKINRLQEKNSKIINKVGYDTRNGQTKEYNNAFNKVTNGGVNKNVDKAAKNLEQAENRYYKNPSMLGYRAKNEAYNKWVDSVNKYMKSTGIKRYASAYAKSQIQRAKNVVSNAEKALRKFEASKFTPQMQAEYKTMRSTNPKYNKYRSLRAEQYRLETKYRNAKAYEERWLNETSIG